MQTLLQWHDFASARPSATPASQELRKPLPDELGDQGTEKQLDARSHAEYRSIEGSPQ